MPFVAQAVTAAVAISAAGRWRLPGAAPVWRCAPVHAPVGGGAWPVAAIAAPLKNQRTPDRACNLAIDLAAELRGCAPWLAAEDPERVGVCVTVSKGGIGPWVDLTPRLARGVGQGGALDVVAHVDILLPDAAGGLVAETGNWRGPRLAPVAACATGVANLACGARLLCADGLAAVVCGGSESSLHPAVLHSMGRMGILDAAPMRPFDRAAAGFNLGEGGALVALETAARLGGRAPLAWLTGACLLADAHHITELHPTRGTLTRVLRRLLADRGGRLRRPLRNLYINAHGTGTDQNDGWETAQLIAAFGADGWARNAELMAPDATVWISGTKSMTGHLLGGSGALEAAICLAVLQGAALPPTFRLREPRACWPAALKACPQLRLLCDLEGDGAAALQPRTSVAAALSLNYGFGGHVGGVLFEREIADDRR